MEFTRPHRLYSGFELRSAMAAAGFNVSLFGDFSGTGVRRSFLAARRRWSETNCLMLWIRRHVPSLTWWPSFLVVVGLAIIVYGDAMATSRLKPGGGNSSGLRALWLPWNFTSHSWEMHRTGYPADHSATGQLFASVRHSDAPAATLAPRSNTVQ